MSSQSFLPVICLGSYSFNYGPNSIDLDSETIIGNKPVIGLKENIEALGFTARKVSMTGFFMSTTNQALLDLQKFAVQQNNGFRNRPSCLSIFSQDSSSASSSQAWFSEPGWFSNMHFTFKGGYALYKYPFRFNWIEANPVTKFPTNTTISQSTLGYNVPITTTGPGWLVGVEVIGASGISTGGIAQSMALAGPGPSGLGPVMGTSANQLFTGNPQVVLSGGASGLPSLKMPLVDNSSPFPLQSIQLTSAVSGNYTVAFNTAWLNGFLPTAINLLFLPQ